MTTFLEPVTPLRSIHAASLHKLTGSVYPILREAGADATLSPFADAAKEAAEMLVLERNPSSR